MEKDQFQELVLMGNLSLIIHKPFVSGVTSDVPLVYPIPCWISQLGSKFLCCPSHDPVVLLTYTHLGGHCLRVGINIVSNSLVIKLK